MSPRPIETSLLKQLKSLGTAKCLLAVSGGADSMALLYACSQLKDKCRVQFAVAHVHHGGTNPYRLQAQKLVGTVSGKLGFEFVTNSMGFDDRSDGFSERANSRGVIASLGESEAELRKFRLNLLKKFKIETASDFVFFAHHQDDLLETRVMRLIRGTGPQGLRAMSQRQGAVIRPFLGFSQAALRHYLSLVKGRHLEDPSNQSSAPLRNWIRREWLPALEAKRPGSVARWGLSLGTIVESLDNAPSFEKCYENFKIVRPEFLILSDADKRRVLGSYLLDRGIRNYGLAHLNELVKRLDVEQKDLTFRLLKKIWLANAKHIWCE